ncbi:MAG: hypothetical protein ABGW78_02420 [Pirellulales bacterium]
MDPLEKLADVKVPPVPKGKTLRDGVRRKLHPRLLMLHIIEFAVGATSWALMHMMVALCATVRFTITGQWTKKQEKTRKK